MNKLKSCPFCGSRAVYVDNTADNCRAIFCVSLNCGAEIKFNVDAMNENEIFEAWNRREAKENPGD